MVKFLLALIFSLLTVLPPAEALCCSEDISQVLPDCCVSHISSTPAVSDICCLMEGTDAVVPAFSFATTYNERSSYVASANQLKLTQQWLKAEKTSRRILVRTPERLASNKIYLLKRSLLI